MNTTALTIERSKVLADEINASHAEVERRAFATFEAIVRTGKLLAEAKAAVGHGQWLKWVRKNLTFGGRQAQRYLRTYRESGQLTGANATRASHLSLRQAEALLAEPIELIKEGTKPAAAIREATVKPSASGKAFDATRVTIKVANYLDKAIDTWPQSEPLLPLVDLLLCTADRAERLHKTRGNK